MYSDLYVLEACFHGHSSSEMVSNEGGELPFFSDPYHFPSSTGFPMDVENLNNQNPGDETPPSLDSFPPCFFSFSPPSTHLENLRLYEREFGNLCVLDGSEAKSEEYCKMGGADYTCNQLIVPQSYSSGNENVSRLMMQRSFSSNCFDKKPGYVFEPSFQSQALSYPAQLQMRRVCSTGDLQNIKDGSLLEEANFKVGRYSAEERKERISKYRAKRSLRNFNKIIKYTCRKTLADNRARIRGRFARNDDTSDIPKPPCSTRDEDEDQFWIEGLHQEYASSYGAPPQFPSYGF